MNLVRSFLSSSSHCTALVINYYQQRINYLEMEIWCSVWNTCRKFQSWSPLEEFYDLYFGATYWKIHSTIEKDPLCCCCCWMVVYIFKRIIFYVSEIIVFRQAILFLLHHPLPFTCRLDFLLNHGHVEVLQQQVGKSGSFLDDMTLSYSTALYKQDHSGISQAKKIPSKLLSLLRECN